MYKASKHAGENSLSGLLAFHREPPFTPCSTHSFPYRSALSLSGGQTKTNKGISELGKIIIQITDFGYSNKINQTKPRRRIWGIV